jgi:hypothetical protein
VGSPWTASHQGWSAVEFHRHGCATDTFRPAAELANRRADQYIDEKSPATTARRITIIMDESIRYLKKAARVRAFQGRGSSIYQQETKAWSTSATLSSEQRASVAIENPSTTTTTTTTAAEGPPPGEQQQQRGPESVSTAAQIRELQKMYLFGLMRVSELEDLQKAPDAILFGNFCGTESTVVAPRQEQ